MEASGDEIELIEETNSGLYGVVWKARQRSLDRIVAVKIVHPSMAHAFNVLDHARGLARAGQHPAIVSVHFVTEIRHPVTGDPAEAVVMEWLEGRTLAERLQGAPMDVAECARIANGLLEGVEFIHGNGLTHSDLHAGNVVITAAGAKIIDIDYSAEKSLALLTTGAKETRVQADIDAAGFLIARMIRQATVDMEVAAKLHDAARAARSFSELNAIVAELTAGPPTDQKPVASKAPDLVASVKRSIEDRRLVTLRDTVLAATEELLGCLVSDRFSVNDPYTPDEMVARVAAYEEAASRLACALAVGCYFGGGDCHELWVEVIDRIGNPFETLQAHNGLSVWLDLRHYPTTILVYAAGIGALLAGKYATLAEILKRPVYYRYGSEQQRLSSTLWAVKAQQRDFWNRDVLKRNAHTPVSVRLEEVLRNPLASLAPQTARYVNAFDRFEYLAALVEFEDNRGSIHPWGPPGNYVWRRKADKSIGLEFQSELRRAGNNWPPLSQGLFSGDGNQFLKLLSEFEEFVARLREHMHVW